MRSLCFLLGCAMFTFSADSCTAQWYQPWYGYNNYGTGYAYGGSGGYGGVYYGDPGTPYSNAVRAQADLTRAQGVAAENAAEAALAVEKARSQYLDNQVKFLTMRREYKATIEARREQRKEEAQARAAARPAPKPDTQLYPRLAYDQLDPLTGDIAWPECLQDDEYAQDRSLVEAALSTQGEFGPDDRSSQIIYDAAHRMMTTRSRRVIELGSEGYASCRRFLNSLAIEGDHAREAQR